MRPSHPILRVGLTGGIASGKSTVAGMLAESGAFVVDADALAHAVTEPGTPAHHEIEQRFGDEVLDDDGGIDRAALGSVVFWDPAARMELNAIVHPRVREEAGRRIADCAARGSAAVAVFDAALLFETGAYRDFDRLVVVRCAAETQLRRLLDRGGLTPREAQRRIDAQAPLRDKLAVADHVIDTDGTFERTRRQSDEVYALLLGEFERRFGGSWP